MQVPRYVWVVYESDDIYPERPDSPCDCKCLGLVKVRGDWRLCLGDFVRNDCNPHPADSDEPLNWKPVLDCSVEERVRTAPHIAKLREEIVVSAEHYITKVDEAVGHLSRALEQF
jgi:hypothetical protein